MNTAGHVSEETARFTNTKIQNLVGNNQSDLGCVDLQFKDDSMSQPCFLGISDGYNEFVRSGDIKVHTGRMVTMSDGTIRIANETDGTFHEIESIAAVILATGFNAKSSLRFLQTGSWPGMKRVLDYNETTREFPIALHVHSTVNRNASSLGFCGFYRSPYWGVVEMQARFLGLLWSGDKHAQQVLATDDTLDSVRLRNDSRRAQFPMGDYAYEMESLREACSMDLGETTTNTSETRGGLVLPCRYIFQNASSEQRSEANRAYSMAMQTLQDSEADGRYVKRGIFRALQGRWVLERDLVSALASHPSGVFTGEATFHPRVPTDEKVDLEYLYAETGEFVTKEGLRFQANRR